MKKSPTNSLVSSRLDSRLLAYAAAATAVGAVVAPAPTEAAVISSGPINITIPTDNVGIYLNVVTGVSATTPAGSPGWDLNPYGSTGLNMFSSTSSGGNAAALGGVGPYVGTGTNYFNLTLGMTVSSASTFANTSVLTISGTTPLNLNSANNYVGFRFFNESTGAVNYGYMQISLSGTAAAQPRAVVSYSYDNTGAAITIIPEPSTFALLGMVSAGAVGVRAWRKRKAA